jgi:hypothetical protein
LAYLVKYRDQYDSRRGHAPSLAAIYPLPRAICKILYTFCKVRGVKVISRFLNNEPKYLELMLRVFIAWDAVVADDYTSTSIKIKVQPLIWEERYVMLMWLSHLLLAPFDLASISSDDIPIPHDNLSILKAVPPNTPKIAQAILSISLRYVVTSGKEREAATTLLARLVLRPDMQRLGLMNILTDWAFSLLQPSSEAASPPVYAYIGVLSFLSRLAVSGQVEDLAPVVVPMFEQSLRIAHGESSVFQTIRSSASARKMIIKILRTLTTLILSIAERGDHRISEDKVSSILEESIDYFLLALADKDTPVRFAASKALAIVTLQLDADMAAEVIEAVIGSLGENILYEKSDGTLVTVFEAQQLNNAKSLKRSLSAVDAQRWQGLILTLAHLLFRRAPPPRQLAEVLQSLVSGLDFEQRSSTGSSIGTGVRDASCFGIWALSRKYSTKELLAVDTATMTLPTEQDEKSVLQMLTVELVCAACLDPSGNIRRGASAALQELIGRHPNTVVEGIPLVQVVDYHSVARRSRAMIEVAKGAASLDLVYWSPLVNSLLSWRGIGSADAESRRTSATSLGELSLQDSYRTINIVLQRLRRRLSNIPHNDVETRHGCFLAIAAVLDALIRHRENTSEIQDHPDAVAVSTEVSRLWDIFDSSFGPTKDDLTLQAARPELTAEASSRLIASLSRAAAAESNLVQVSTQQLEKSLDILLLCVSRGEDAAIEASAEAASNLFQILPMPKQEETIQGWFANIHASWRSATGRGQISALGAVFHRLHDDSSARDFIIEELLRCTTEEEIIEKRVAAVRCLATGVLPHIGSFSCLFTWIASY